MNDNTAQYSNKLATRPHFMAGLFLLVLLSLFSTEMPRAFAQEVNQLNLPELGEPTVQSPSVTPNVNAEGAGFSYRDNINGKLLSVSPQYNRQNGAAIGGSFASPVGKNIAAGILLMAGEDRNEWLVNLGLDLSSHHRMIFSLGQLRQKLNFNFVSGNEKAEVTQDNGAVSYQYLLGKDWLNAAEVNAYISNANSINLRDKTFFTDTVSLYELWNDPRRIAGGRVVGAQGRLVFTPTARTTFKVGLGAERLTYDYLTGNDSTTRATGSAELLQRLDYDFNFRASVNAAASQNRYALGLGKSFKDGSQLGLDVSTIEGRDGVFNDNRVQLTYTQSFGGDSSITTSQATNNLDASVKQNLATNVMPTSSSKAWASSLVEQVSRRPSFLPSQVVAKVDSTATPTRLIAIDKTGLPNGSAVATSTGAVTVPIGISVSAIAGVTLNGSAFTNNGQFVLSGTTNFVINPNLITQPAVGSTDTYVVTMNNTTGGGTTLATVTVSHGSTRIDSVVISSGTIMINTAAISGVTAPVAGATPVTSVSGTGYTGTVTWSPSVSGTFAYNTAYTATVTLTPTTGYTVSGVTANFFTVSGATATNSANSGVVAAVFPATTATLPSGYIISGNLTWAPITTRNFWSVAAATCSALTALGYSAGTWRQPTSDELVALYNARSSGITPAGWPPAGWTLENTWSSSTYDTSHYYVRLLNSAVGQGTSDFNNYYVSCVH